MQDYHDKKIVLGTYYYLTGGNGYRFKIRGRLIAGSRIEGITIQNTESEDHYDYNYRKVIINYIKRGILWIKD
jgi:hypothetical protein